MLVIRLACVSLPREIPACTLQISFRDFMLLEDNEAKGMADIPESERSAEVTAEKGGREYGNSQPAHASIITSGFLAGDCP